jgi:hypothetical protein
MTVTQFNQTKTQSLLLGNETEVTRAQAREILGGISQPTCWRYLTCLQKTQPRGFDYIPGNRYLSSGTVQALYQFKQLVEKFQYEGAVPRIKQHMENFYGIQESS